MFNCSEVSEDSLRELKSILPKKAEIEDIKEPPKKKQKLEHGWFQFLSAPAAQHPSPTANSQSYSDHEPEPDSEDTQQDSDQNSNSPLSPRA